MLSRGIGILTFNRGHQIGSLIEAVLSTKPNFCKVVVCDDGSTDNTFEETKKYDVLYIRSSNKGVAFTKNKALYALQDCSYIALLEDDLFPVATGWMEDYETVSMMTDNHHFCRVQDKEVPETHPDFKEFLHSKGFTPVYGPSPRGDFTFITKTVLQQVGGLNPKFLGVGYAHGEWSERINSAGLIAHPLKWWDIIEARSKFVQRGDTSGGRWATADPNLKAMLRKNKKIAAELKGTGYTYCPLVLE
jgi:glycosyltransferase involved in cell wall biosynthesis